MNRGHPHKTFGPVSDARPACQMEAAAASQVIANRVFAYSEQFRMTGAAKRAKTFQPTFSVACSSSIASPLFISARVNCETIGRGEKVVDFERDIDCQENLG